jgi:ABC-2 type transport system permease protein
MFSKISSIAWKDAIIRFSSRSEILFFLILPLVFIFLLGGGLQGGGESVDERIALPVVDEDNSDLSRALLDELATSATVSSEPMPRSEAETLLAENDVAAVLTISAGFEETLLAVNEQPSAVTLDLQSAPNNTNALAAEQAVQLAAGNISRPLLIARNSLDAAETIQPFADDTARQSFFSAALEQAREAWAARPSRITVLSAGAEEESNGYDQAAQVTTGQLVTWVFIPLLGTSGLLAYERTTGTLRRLLITPTRKGTFLLGMISGQLGLALVQMALLVVFGIVVMKVSWGDPAALALLLVTFGLASVALGIMLGTFVKTDGQAVNLSIMAGMVMALLGGCWWPLELFPEGLQQAVRVLPTTWAMDGLTTLTMRGGGLEDVALNAAVLVGFAAVFFLVGIWRFRYE